MRLAFADLLGAEADDTREAVGPAATFKLVQRRQLFPFSGHDDLAAACVRDAMLQAKAVHGLTSHDTVVHFL